MSPDTWPADNNRYLAASLEWLRLRLKLQQLAAGSEAPPAAPGTQMTTLPQRAQSAPRRGWFGHDEPVTVVTASATTAPATAPPAPSTALQEAAERRRAAAAIDPPPALLMLAQRLGLSAFETDTLLLCAAVELDPGMAALIGAAQGQPARTNPTFSLALQLFADASWDALSPLRPLRYARLVDLNQPGATPLIAAALRADERVVHYIKGLNAIDERLTALLVGDGSADAPLLSATQQATADRVLQRLGAASLDAQVPLVTLLGTEATSKLDTARAVCAGVGRRLYRLPLEALPTVRTETDSLARLWQRECLLLPIALYIDADELDSAPPDVANAFRHFVSRDLGLAFVALREAPASALAGAWPADVARPTAQEQHQAWLEGLQPRVGDEAAARGAAELAGQFNLNLREIQHALDGAAIAPAQSRLDAAWADCRRTTQPRLDQLAQRIDVRATWDDLVLSDEALALLRQVAAQVRHRYQVYEDWGYAKKLNRGMGISALFAGESGTGKTMAAEVIANELGLALYRIDLSAVVSKYIGETEKNLRRLFDAAEQGGAILLFDEADALFGKRSEVKDSHDRYANIEINYLLQRMEAFSGLAILATNMKSALDSAFLRRLRFIVNFQYPGPAERKRMWQRSLPPGVPHDELDFERLARFGLSGGNIHSVTLNAAFMAAATSAPVSQALMMAALRAELRKLDKPVSEADFR